MDGIGDAEKAPQSFPKLPFPLPLEEYFKLQAEDQSIQGPALLENILAGKNRRNVNLSNLGMTDSHEFQENLYDTRLSHDIPQQYLQIVKTKWAPDSDQHKLITKQLDNINKLKQLYPHFHLKPSSHKFENDYRCMPTNLQLTTFSINQKLFDTVTFGVASDLCDLNFEMGGLTKMRENNLENTDYFRMRQQICMSQILPAVCLGISAKLERNFGDGTFWEFIENNGILLHFESLISTRKGSDERIMLSDYAITVLEELSDVSVNVRMGNGFLSSVDITEENGKIFLNFTLKSKTEMVKSGIKVVPTLFSTGLNVNAERAFESGENDLQIETNFKSFNILKTYVDSSNANPSNSNPSKSLFSTEIDKLSSICDKAFQKTISKDPRIHELSQYITRELFGVRFVQCKSAKDRTGQGVCLEQVRLLQRFEGLKPEFFKEVLNRLQRDGLGLLRCYKNTAVAFYNFNETQVEVMPVDYRPPVGTFQKHLRSLLKQQDSVQ